MKNIEKSITGFTYEDWSGTLELLLGLRADPFDNQEITDNPWSFKIRNKGK
jgi:hypothetical protein